MDRPYQLLNEADFSAYTSAWEALLSSDDPSLERPFLFNGQFLNYLYLKVADVLPLLSAVGTDAVKMKFALLPVSSPSGPAQVFSSILYGVKLADPRVDGSTDTPTTAYFCAAVPSLTGQISQVNAQAVPGGQAVALGAADMQSVPFHPVDYILVEQWVNKWNEQQGVITAEMFKSIFGNLHGYTYALDDFLLALKPLKSESLAPESLVQLLIVFGLHPYFKPGNTDANRPNLLFGTVLMVASARQAGESTVIELSSDLPYFDISKPCPPYC